jgi:hypothetical protein
VLTVTTVTDAEFERLLQAGFEREAVHLEMRDAHATEVELPHLASWAAGEANDPEWLGGWCAMLREHVKAGRSVRRARIVFRAAQRLPALVPQHRRAVRPGRERTPESGRSAVRPRPDHI